MCACYIAGLKCNDGIRTLIIAPHVPSGGPTAFVLALLEMVTYWASQRDDHTKDYLVKGEVVRSAKTNLGQCLLQQAHFQACLGLLQRQ